MSALDRILSWLPVTAWRGLPGGAIAEQQQEDDMAATALQARASGALESLFASTDPRSAKEARTRLNNLIKTDQTLTMTITPAMAEIMLERNTGNRLLRRNIVADYAADMQAGNWKLTGEPVIFSKSGELNDGQHRLHACVQAGVAFRSDVRFGVERDAFICTDVGFKRTVCDGFTIQQEEMAGMLGAGLRLYRSYLAEDYSFRGRLTPQLATDMLAQHPEMRDAAALGARVNRHFKAMPASVATVCWYICSRIQRDAATAFFTFVETGEGIKRGDPAYALRLRLINEAAAKGRVSNTEYIAITLKAWNYWRQGRSMSAARWRNEGRAPEPFPVAE